MTKAYLLGVLHDGTVRKLTYRISSKDLEFIDFLITGIKKMGYKAWKYKEGIYRHLYIAEFSKNVLKNAEISSIQQKIDYLRGYFDAEGGISRKAKVRYYLYYAQKNKKDLEVVKSYLEELKISCGKIHNPSKKVDSNYWRFFIRANSYNNFAKIIGSWHPIKSRYLRVKI